MNICCHILYCLQFWFYSCNRRHSPLKNVRNSPKSNICVRQIRRASQHLWVTTHGNTLNYIRVYSLSSLNWLGVIVPPKHGRSVVGSAVCHWDHLTKCMPWKILVSMGFGGGSSNLWWGGGSSPPPAGYGAECPAAEYAAHSLEGRGIKSNKNRTVSANVYLPQRCSPGVITVQCDDILLSEMLIQQPRREEDVALCTACSCLYRVWRQPSALVLLLFLSRNAVLSQEWCLSVCRSVGLSVTRRYCVHTAKRIIKHFSPSGSSHSVPVFPHQTSRQYADGNPLKGALNAGVWKNRDFRSISRFISKTTQDMATVIIKCK